MSPSPSGRVHVVLVPGFTGFDALGQIHYYAGVTPVFRDWQRSVSTAHVALHYFDNFPTAGVATRAERLGGYLATRFARGEFVQDRDAIALVGHSTGGLDIRRLVQDLADERHGARPIRVDGADQTAVTVRREDLLGMVKRLVFLSVPQWGTNIADWVRTYPEGRKIALREILRLVKAARVPQLNDIERFFAHVGADVTRADLFCAMQDAVSEIDVSAFEGDPAPTAAALESAGELETWLSYMVSDFAAIDDLAARPPDARSPRRRGSDDEGRASPAHMKPDDRAKEIERWDIRGIQRRSYATWAKCPFGFRSGVAVPTWEFAKPSTYLPGLLAPSAGADTDIIFRSCYRACAGGPFKYPPGMEPRATLFGSSESRQVELWDNDGIVNTASMLWPDGPRTQLLNADHGDIIGHYRRLVAVEGSRRKYGAYDIFKSGSDFTEETFTHVWRDVFSFCASALDGWAPTAA